uniref:Proline rich transmembrane protein 4a n=1 Tax=Oryzias melastigma TaxID=30732 RepID=A0A3B3D7V9_ORYME
MVVLWNIDVFLVFFLTSSLHVEALTGKNARNTSQTGTTVSSLNPASHRPHGSRLTPDDPEYGPEVVALRWPSSPEDIDRQGVIGEYTESDETSETSLENHYEGRLIFRPTESTANNVTPRERIETVVLSPEKAAQKPTPEQKLNFWSRKKASGSISYPTQASQNEISVTTRQYGTTDSHLSFSPSRIRETTEMKVKSTVVSQTNPTPTAFMDNNNRTSVTPCKTTNQSWTPPYQEDSIQSLHPFLALGPPLVPLYSDWNSAFATWGFAWEAHIYGVGSIFILFCLISVISLLGLPFRCPPGSLYIAMLHFFLMACAGIQAFSLLYDAYSSQDRLPPVVALLLSELPLPCLISAFSFAFLFLSSHSRKHLSLPLALFHSLPPVLLLIPHAVFVCLSVFLSLSYLLHCCLTKINTKHIYRLNDNVEGGGSPELIRSVNVTFSRLENWKRATGAGIGTSMCLLGCGGLQLYGILHAFGVGGVKGYGFLPWPWWGYHLGCRLCESGVCLGLSIIGTHSLFCHKSSTKTLTSSRPGSWSRLSCNSPLREQTMSTQDGVNSPVVSSHKSWSKGKQDKLVICDVATKKKTEVLPLSSEVHAPANGVNGLHQGQGKLPLPKAPSPPLRTKSPMETQLDSLSVETDSTKDFRPPSPIDLSRSIDQALFSESLFSHSIFGPQRLSVGHTFYRTSSCGDVDHPQGDLTSHNNLPVSPEKCNWKGSDTGSTQGLCSYPKESGKFCTHSWANRGQNFAQCSLQRGIPHLSYRRHYRTLSLASQDGKGGGKLAGTKHLSESRQLEWDMAVQAEFVNVCRQIDALSVCSDTIEL